MADVASCWAWICRNPPETVKQFQSNLLTIFFFHKLIAFFRLFSIDRQKGDDMHSIYCWHRNTIETCWCDHTRNIHCMCNYINKPRHKVGLGCRHIESAEHLHTQADYVWALNIGLIFNNFGSFSYLINAHYFNRRSIREYFEQLNHHENFHYN